MGAQLTDFQKKKIIADYLETENLSETARRNGVVPSTVQRLVQDCEDFEELARQKKDQNTADILAYMESKRAKVCEIIGIYLNALPDLDNFKNLSPTQLTTAIGTLISSDSHTPAFLSFLTDATAISFTAGTGSYAGPLSFGKRAKPSLSSFPSCISNSGTCVENPETSKISSSSGLVVFRSAAIRSAASRAS